MKTIKIIVLVLGLLLISKFAYAGQVLITPIINNCVTIGAKTTYTTSPIYIAGYDGYLGYSFTAVDATGGNFTQTNAYLVYQVWDNSQTAYFQSYPNTTSTLYGSNGYPATSAWQITSNTITPSSVTAKKGSIHPPVSAYIMWSIINLGGTAITTCTLNMDAQ